MSGRVKVWKRGLPLAGVVLLVAGGCGDKELPEKPGSGTHEVSKETLAKVIEDHAAQQGASFKFTHPDTKKGLSLTLIKVHKDRLSKVAENRYFACSDFKEAGGTVYDLDFWVNASGGQLTVTKTMLHKEAGKPRYTWHQEGGVWKQKFASSAKTGAKQPKKEHPEKKHPEKKPEHPEKPTGSDSKGAEHPQ